LGQLSKVLEQQDAPNTKVCPTNIDWLVVSAPLKNMKVNWDAYSQYMEGHKIPWFQTTNQ
jgi:hypothetical protein